MTDEEIEKSIADNEYLKLAKECLSIVETSTLKDKEKILL